MLRIGNIELDLPFVQAALSGYSDLAMRRLARRYGAPYTLNEVVLDKLVVQPGKKQRAFLRVTDDDHPVGGQLMGADPDVFAPAAFAMAQAGIAAGAAGAIVEVHSCPDRALCDGPQAVLPHNFAKLMEQIRQIAEIVGHRVTLWGREDAPPRRAAVGGWAT